MLVCTSTFQLHVNQRRYGATSGLRSFFLLILLHHFTLVLINLLHVFVLLSIHQLITLRGIIFYRHTLRLYMAIQLINIFCLFLNHFTGLSLPQNPSKHARTFIYFVFNFGDDGIGILPFFRSWYFFTMLMLLLRCKLCLFFCSLNHIPLVIPQQAIISFLLGSLFLFNIWYFLFGSRCLCFSWCSFAK